MSVLGIDLGGTKIAAIRFSNDGSILNRQNILLDKRVGAEVGTLIKDLISSEITSVNSADPVRAIGISVPGISRSATGTVWAPNIQGWDDYPLLSEAKSVVAGLPVTIESDRACSILGETWHGKAAGCRDAIFLAIGTGIGAGILAGGKILHGAHDIGGAIGWMALNQPYLDEYTNCGCFEYYAAGPGIARSAQNLIRQQPGYKGRLSMKPVEHITSYDIFEAFQENDPLAAEVFAVCVSYWGMAVANLVSIFNPEKIIFGGGVFGPGVQFIPDIKKEAKKWAQPISIQKVSLEASALGPEAAVYGAAYQALLSITNSKE